MSNDPRDNPHFMALADYHTFVGAFVAEYGQLEHILRHAIRNMSGLDSARYDLLVGFPRTSEIRSLARKLLDLYELPDAERMIIQDAFLHLADITQLRDRLVHYGAHPVADGGVVVFNKDGSYAQERDAISKDNLWAAARDLTAIRLIMARLIGLPPGSIVIGETRPTWRYKPPPPANTHQKRDDRKVPKRQRPSSGK